MTVYVVEVHDQLSQKLYRNTEPMPVNTIYPILN